MTTTIQVLAAFSIISMLLFLATRAMKRAKLRRFGPRDRLNDPSLIALFSSSGEADDKVLRFLDLVADASDIPKGLIRPGDRFDSELAPERGWEFDDGLTLLPSALASEFGGTPKEYDLSQNPTVMQLFAVVVRKKGEEI